LFTWTVEGCAEVDDDGGGVAVPAVAAAAVAACKKNDERQEESERKSKTDKTMPSCAVQIRGGAGQWGRETGMEWECRKGKAACMAGDALFCFGLRAIRPATARRLVVGGPGQLRMRECAGGLDRSAGH